MSSKRIRQILLWIWLIFLLLDISVFLVLYFQKYIELVDLKISLKTINALFAPYLGAIIVYFFNNQENKTITGKNAIAGTLALVGSIIWNILIFIFLVPLLWLQGTIEDSLEIITNIGTLFVWLIAASLGYYFAKD